MASVRPSLRCKLELWPLVAWLWPLLAACRSAFSSLSMALIVCCGVGEGYMEKEQKKHNDLIITCYLWKSPLRHSGSRDCLSDLLKALCFDSGLDMIISASVRRINQIVISYTLLPPPSVPVSLSLSRQDIRLRSILNSRISKQILWPGDSQTGDRGVQ